MVDTEASQKIDEFEMALDRFKKDIDSGIVLHTSFVSSSVLERVGEIGL